MAQMQMPFDGSVDVAALSIWTPYVEARALRPVRLT